jgi:hypothetical protein
MSQKTKRTSTTKTPRVRVEMRSLGGTEYAAEERISSSLVDKMTDHQAAAGDAASLLRIYEKLVAIGGRLAMRTAGAVIRGLTR